MKMLSYSIKKTLVFVKMMLDVTCTQLRSSSCIRCWFNILDPTCLSKNYCNSKV